MTAAEAALRKARAALDHADTFYAKHRKHCVIAEWFADRGMFTHGWTHRAAASAVLDGQDVEAVTKAGG